MEMFTKNAIKKTENQAFFATFRGNTVTKFQQYFLVKVIIFRLHDLL